MNDGEIQLKNIIQQQGNVKMGLSNIEQRNDIDTCKEAKKTKKQKNLKINLQLNSENIITDEDQATHKLMFLSSDCKHSLGAQIIPTKFKQENDSQKELGNNNLIQNQIPSTKQYDDGGWEGEFSTNYYQSDLKNFCSQLQCLDELYRQTAEYNEKEGKSCREGVGDQKKLNNLKLLGKINNLEHQQQQQNLYSQNQFSKTSNCNNKNNQLLLNGGYFQNNQFEKSNNYVKQIYYQKSSCIATTSTTPSSSSHEKLFKKINKEQQPQAISAQIQKQEQQKQDLTKEIVKQSPKLENDFIKQLKNIYEKKNDQEINNNKITDRNLQNEDKKIQIKQELLLSQQQQRQNQKGSPKQSQQQIDQNGQVLYKSLQSIRIPFKSSQDSKRKTYIESPAQLNQHIKIKPNNCQLDSNFSSEDDLNYIRERSLKKLPNRLQAISSSKQIKNQVPEQICGKSYSSKQINQEVFNSNNQLLKCNQENYIKKINYSIKENDSSNNMIVNTNKQNTSHISFLDNQNINQNSNQQILNNQILQDVLKQNSSNKDQITPYLHSSSNNSINDIQRQQNSNQIFTNSYLKQQICVQDRDEIIDQEKRNNLNIYSKNIAQLYNYQSSGNTQIYKNTTKIHKNHNQIDQSDEQSIQTNENKSVSTENKLSSSPKYRQLTKHPQQNLYNDCKQINNINSIQKPKQQKISNLINQQNDQSNQYNEKQIQYNKIYNIKSDFEIKQQSKSLEKIQSHHNHNIIEQQFSSLNNISFNIKNNILYKLETSKNYNTEDFIIPQTYLNNNNNNHTKYDERQIFRVQQNPEKLKDRTSNLIRIQQNNKEHEKQKVSTSFYNKYKDYLNSNNMEQIDITPTIFNPSLQNNNNNINNNLKSYAFTKNQEEDKKLSPIKQYLLSDQKENKIIYNLQTKNESVNSIKLPYL